MTEQSHETSELGSVAIVLIVKDEERFLPEWIAHHIALGVDQIVLYDNASTDRTQNLVTALAGVIPIEYREWRSPPNQSPQRTAYAHALRHLRTRFNWIAFFDCDEFLVLDSARTIQDFLAGFGPDVSAVAINWLTFGSSGVLDTDYGLVTDTFRFGPDPDIPNNRHFKTIVRPNRAKQMRIHDAILTEGRYVTAGGRALTMGEKRGLSDHVDHQGARLLHYQLKSRADFHQKISRGRAGTTRQDPTWIRPDPERLFRRLDLNTHRFDDIDRHRVEFERAFDLVSRTLLAHNGLADLARR